MVNPFQPGLLQRLPRPPRKVAVLRPSRIGDFICAGPAFRALRRALPEAEIAVITLPMLQDLVVRLPYVDRFIAFPGFPGLAEQLFDAGRTLEFFTAMQAERFDLAIQMQGSGVYSNPFTLMLGARWSVGFVRQGDAAGRLDAALALPDQGHEVQRVLALPVFLGAGPNGEETLFPLFPRDHELADRCLDRIPAPWIGVHAGAREAVRRWSSEHFAAVARRLRQACGGSVVILGGAEEHARGEALRQAIGPAAANLAGRLSLGTLGAVVARLTVLLTNDSGPAHVAYALGTPTVTVCPSGDATRYGPPPGPFRAVVPNQANAAQQIDQVLNAARELLARAA